MLGKETVQKQWKIESSKRPLHKWASGEGWCKRENACSTDGALEINLRLQSLEHHIGPCEMAFSFWPESVENWHGDKQSEYKWGLPINAGDWSSSMSAPDS